VIVPTGYQGDWTAKQVYQGYLADGMSAGSAEAYTEVLTGEALPEILTIEQALQKAAETGFGELAAQVDEYQKQGIQHVSIEFLSEDEVDVEPVFEAPVFTPFQKAAGGQPEAEEEWRYTLGPVYMPGTVDAHGDSIDADELERAIWDYVKSGDRRIRLQHNTEVIAGEWVGLLTWPWEVTVPVIEEGRSIQRTYPAGTPFMGVQWTQEVWDKLVKPGHIRGYSLGGFAEFMEVEFEKSADWDSDWPFGVQDEKVQATVPGTPEGESGVQKYAPGQARDGHGRFASGGMGGAHVSAEVNPETGYRLTAHAEADKVHAKAAANEPAVTARMKALAAAHGARLEGLEFRLKEKKSLARKINADANAEHITDAEAAANISDAVRYTMIQKEANYASTAGAVLDDFHNAGYGIRSKNFWQQGDPYQGINVALTAPDGQKIELQFHTQESLDVKMARNHPLYEEYRTSTDNARRKVLWDQMVGNAAKIPVPGGVMALPQLKLQTFATAQESGLL
jgi:hypothetical protein